MNIIFNNQPQQIQEQTTVLHLLHQLMGDKHNGIAVAINNALVPKDEWHHHILQPNDQILVIKATQGG